MAHEPASAAGHPAEALQPQAPRRNFLTKATAILVGAALPVVPAIAAVGSFINPLFPWVKAKQRPSGSKPMDDGPGFFRTLPASEVAVEPQLFQIIAEKKDAWNVYPSTAIGSIYLQKISDLRLMYEEAYGQGGKKIDEYVATVPEPERKSAFKELLETDLALRHKPKDGHHAVPVTAADKQKLVEEYKKQFPTYAKEVDEVVALERWEPAIRVFNVECPHAGCSVDCKTLTGGKKVFKCPCHNSEFELDGRRDAGSPSARDLDRIDYQIEDGQLWVRFLKFKPGHVNQEPV